MKKCIVEIMKDIRALEEEKSALYGTEECERTVSYSKGEEPVAVDYDFNVTRSGIARIDSRIRYLRYMLNKANNEIRIDEMNMSLGECVVYLAQLNNEKCRISNMMRIPKLTKHLSYSGVVEYTEACFEREDVAAEIKKLSDTIRRLQILIDRTNLTVEVEISES